MATKTKEAAMKAARKALGNTAAEGVDYNLRNTGAGWDFEPTAPANEPARKARAAKAPKPSRTPLSDRREAAKENVGRKRAARKEAAEAPKRAPRRKLADAVKPKPQGERPAPASQTKTDLIMGMIRRAQGATSKEMEVATGWAPHSVRGLLGTFRANGIKVVSSKEKGQPTVYRLESAAEPGDVI